MDLSSSEKKNALIVGAEYFKGQFSWPYTVMPSVDNSILEPWLVNLQPPTTLELRDYISAHKLHRATGSDNIPPALFKDGGETLIQCLKSFIGSI